jgi:Zn-dependent protease with chaperone function
MRRVVIAFLFLLVTTVVAAEPARRFTVRVTPEMKRHSRIYDVLYFAGSAYGVAVLWLLMKTGISMKLRDVASRARWRFLIAMAYFALFTLVTSAFHFPLSLYASFIVPHQFGLTHQTFLSWLGDFAKGIGVDATLGAFVAALTLLGIHLFRRWWLVLWLGSIPVIIAGVIITPLIIDPLFNDFVPLKDPVMRRDLLEMAQRAGIEGGRVYQVNKSKQTTTMNAYVTGLGVSKRIVMWDTLLQKLDHDEIMATMGHEMGHYVLHHLWKGIAFAIAVSFVILLIAQPLYERGMRRFGLTERGDPAALPLLLMIASVSGFLLSPVTSAYSRTIEHDADRFGLELTHLNEATASSFVKFAEDAKADPDPPAFIEWWRYSHPSTNKRIAFALEYEKKK